MSLRDRLRVTETGWLRSISVLEAFEPVRWLMLLCTRIADGWGLVVIIPTALLLGGRSRGVAAVGLGTISAISTAVVVQSIKAVVRRRRPQGIDLEHPIDAPDRHAFPSGHTAQAFGMVLITWWLAPGFGFVTLLFAFGVGLSRMFFGLHYPTDVVVGAGIGLFVASTTIDLCERYGMVEWLMHLFG